MICDNACMIIVYDCISFPNIYLIPFKSSFYDDVYVNCNVAETGDTSSYHCRFSRKKKL